MSDTRRDSGTADTRIMGVVHSALRRDLERARLVLQAPELEERRCRALGHHLGWLMGFLERHHTAEDCGLYPLVRDRDPSIGALLDRMDAEHAAVHTAMDQVRRTALALQSGRGRVEARSALERLAGVLLPHLEHEERELMPLVDAALTEAEWRQLDKTHNIDTKSKRELAFEGHWLIDGLPTESHPVVTGLVPPVPRFVLVHLLGGAYRRHRVALWGGSPAAEVPSLALEPSC